MENRLSRSDGRDVRKALSRTLEDIERNNPKSGSEKLEEPTKIEIKGNHLPHKSHQKKRRSEWGNKEQQKTNRRNNDRYNTPKNRRPVRPIKLFRKIQDKHLAYKERNIRFKINEDIEDMDLQVILMNTQTITVSK